MKKNSYHASLKQKKNVDKDIRKHMTKKYFGIKGLTTPLQEFIWKNRILNYGVNRNLQHILGARKVFFRRKLIHIRRLRLHLVKSYQAKLHKIKSHNLLRKRLTYSGLLKAAVYKTFQIKVNRLRIIGRREGKRKAIRALNIQPLGKPMPFLKCTV